MFIKPLFSALVLAVVILVTAQTFAAPPAETAIGLQYRGNHVALRVADLETSVQWWSDVFGAREVRRSAVPNVSPDIEIVFMHIAGGFHIELVGGGTPEERGAPEDIAADYGVAGYKHIGFLVADLNPVLDHMARFGVEPDYRVTREDYGVEIVLIKEPSGRYVELYAPLTTARTEGTDR